MIEFEKLNIYKVEEIDNYGKFVVELLECGYGMILGNFFWCVMLVFLLGVVIISI